jgi:ribosomal protein S12 methylthiotransferase accessory factor
MTGTLEIRLEEDERVVATWGGHELVTDQNESAPTPFDLFLASVGTCTGYYVARFCRSRQLDPTGIRIRERTVEEGTTHRLARIEIEVALPPEFPARYREAVLRAAGQCAVKRALESPPVVEVALAEERVRV